MIINNTFVTNIMIFSYGASWPCVIMAVILWSLDLQLPVQSVPITTDVVSSNPVHGEMYSIQHYVIKFVSVLHNVGGFLLVLRFPPPIKLTATIKLKFC
jgi:hypothetical protein